jgi:proline iminopeptidase
MRLRKILIAILALVVAVPVVGAAGVVGWRVHLQNKIAKARKIEGPNTIDVMETITIGGIPQVVRIRGRSLDNPVLLYLHGGPGTPMIPFAHRFGDYLEKDFTVVQWDQRGAGKTAALSDATVIQKTMSIPRMEGDILEMTNYLRKRFHKNKIVLLGHSWGTIIGAPLAKRHPELYSVFVGTGLVVAPVRSEATGYAHTLEEARRMGVKKAVEELEAIAPFPGPNGSLDHLSVRHKWNAYFGESVYGYRDMADAMAKYAWESPDYTLSDFSRLMNDSDAYKNIDPYVNAYDVERFGMDWPLPVVIIQGKHDWQTSYDTALDWFGRITAPHKEFLTIEAGAHAPMAEEPAEFGKLMHDHVRPLAVAGEAAAAPPN